MSGTSAGDELIRRAIHEAGHYVIARSLDVVAKPVWVTIEPRGLNGGSCWWVPKSEVSQWNYGCVLLAGLAAEATHLCIDQLTLEPHSLELLKTNETLIYESLSAAVAEAERGAHSDLISLKEIVDPNEEQEGALLAASLALVLSYWGIVELISRELQERITLYHEEPDFILGIHAAEQQGRQKDRQNFERMLQRYRDERKEIEPITNWQDGLPSGAPVPRWYEDFHTWSRRSGLT